MITIDELKRQWNADPCWDIERSEGFEAHYAELLQYRLDTEHEWQERERKRKQFRAEALGCSVELIGYLEGLEARIRDLEQ